MGHLVLARRGAVRIGDPPVDCKPRRLRDRGLCARNPRPDPGETAMTKKLFIKTYGCQMNVYDSERMADVLRPLGYAPTETADDADFVILNTCHIREKAAEKVYSELGKLRELKEAKAATTNTTMTIAVAGCVAQAEGEEIMRRQPAVDLVVGPQAYHQLPELLTRTARARGVKQERVRGEHKAVLLVGGQGVQRDKGKRGERKLAHGAVGAQGGEEDARAAGRARPRH